jgi:peroxiredoxin
MDTKMPNILIFATFIMVFCLIINFVLSLAIARRLKELTVKLNVYASTPVIKTLIPGQVAPNFIAHSSAGKEVFLQDFESQNVAFIFFHSECNACLEKLPSLQKLYPKVKLAGVHLVLVTDEPPSTIDAFLHKMQITIPIIFSLPDKSTLQELYNPSKVTPFYCFINSNGFVVSTEPLGSSSWLSLEKTWEAMANKIAFSQQMLGRN